MQAPNYPLRKLEFSDFYEENPIFKKSNAMLVKEHMLRNAMTRKLRNVFGMTSDECGLDIQAFMVATIDGKLHFLFNPEIKDAQTFRSWDDIDSIFNFHVEKDFLGNIAVVTRHNFIEVEYLDEIGLLCKQFFHGPDAYTIQQMIDNLNGIDHVSKFHQNCRLI